MDLLQLRMLAEQELSSRPASAERSHEHTPLLYELRVHEVMVQLLLARTAQGGPTESIVLRFRDIFSRLQDGLDDLAEAPKAETPASVDDLRALVEEGAALTARLEAVDKGRDLARASARTSGTHLLGPELVATRDIVGARKRGT